ncbi:hypothetical protein Q1695_009158 [Nippostrongylus brasiliensis]|nr:hypothetical protein Q1695_009158 [Nippostrongylus brasiliensis]
MNSTCYILCYPRGGLSGEKKLGDGWATTQTHQTVPVTGIISTWLSALHSAFYLFGEPRATPITQSLVCIAQNLEWSATKQRSAV